MNETNLAMLQSVNILTGEGVAGGIAARTALGGLFALGVSGVAYAGRSLSRSGAVAAVVCGTVCAAAGWSWAILLVAYFVTTTLVSRYGSAHKDARTASMVAKGGRRDAVQVFANGGVYATCAAMTLVSASPVWTWGAIGALAASAADSWSTEIGLLFGGTPRSIISRTIVRDGESGGVTAAGTAGGLVGAMVIALVAIALRFPRGAALASLVAGVSGSMADSVLGATIQERRYCDACDAPTERDVHTCGHATRHVSGIRWLDNDVVNTLATLAGFAVGVVLEMVAGALMTRGSGG